MKADSKPADTLKSAFMSPASTNTSSSVTQLTTAPSDKFTKLQLLKGTQQLEVKKLELQLQLAQLQGNHPASSPATDLTTGKSLGNLKVLQKILHSQQWPHIFAPGEPKLYNDLTMPEFCTGILVIMGQTQPNLPSQRFWTHSTTHVGFHI